VPGLENIFKTSQQNEKKKDKASVIYKEKVGKAKKNGEKADDERKPRVKNTNKTVENNERSKLKAKSKSVEKVK
jgi:hypothetical protein